MARGAFMGNDISELAMDCSDDFGSQGTKPVDLVHLSKQTFGSKDLEIEVLGLFLSHSVQCLNRLKVAENDKDWADAAHSIKGSANTIGAWMIGELAETYERKACKGELADKEGACQEIETLVNETNCYISTFLIEAA